MKRTYVDRGGLPLRASQMTVASSLFLRRRRYGLQRGQHRTAGGYPELPEGRCGVIGPICMPTQPSEAVVRGIHLRSFAVRV